MFGQLNGIISIQFEAENDITMSSIQKHVVLTIEEKFKIIKDLENDENAMKLAKIRDVKKFIITDI